MLGKDERTEEERGRGYRDDRAPKNQENEMCGNLIHLLKKKLYLISYIVRNNLQ